MKKLIVAFLTMLAIVGCGAAPEPTQQSAVEVESTAPTNESDAIPMTNLAPLKIGVYDVQPMYEEKLEDGHFNIRITGGEVVAVREWVGPEDASGVIVVKTEIERDYHHGHVEMPAPIPDDARLWIEIETPSGETLKGSTPLK